MKATATLKTPEDVEAIEDLIRINVDSAKGYRSAACAGRSTRMYVATPVLSVNHQPIVARVNSPELRSPIRAAQGEWPCTTRHQSFVSGGGAIENTHLIDARRILTHFAAVRLPADGTSPRTGGFRCCLDRLRSRGHVRRGACEPPVRQGPGGGSGARSWRPPASRRK